MLEWHVYYYYKRLAEEISHLHNWVIEVFLEVSARTITWIICLDPRLLCSRERGSLVHTVFTHTVLGFLGVCKVSFVALLKFVSHLILANEILSPKFLL